MNSNKRDVDHDFNEVECQYRNCTEVFLRAKRKVGRNKLFCCVQCRGMELYFRAKDKKATA